MRHGLVIDELRHFGRSHLSRIERNLLTPNVEETKITKEPIIETTCSFPVMAQDGRSAFHAVLRQQKQVLRALKRSELRPRVNAVPSMFGFQSVSNIRQGISQIGNRPSHRGFSYDGSL
jgi:hypothetical protein